MYVAARRGLRCASNEPAKLLTSRRKPVRNPIHSPNHNSSRNISIFPWGGHNTSNQEHNAAVWNNEKGRWEPLETPFITSTSAKEEVDHESSQSENPNPPSISNGTEDKDKSNNYGSAFKRSQRNKKPQSKEIPLFSVPFEFLSNNVRRHKFDSAISQGFLHLSGLEEEADDHSAAQNATESPIVPSVAPPSLESQPTESSSSGEERDALLVKFYASFQECCKLYAQMHDVYGPPGESAQNWEELPDMLSEMPNLATKWDRISTEFEEIAGQAIAAFPNGELARKLCDDLSLDNAFAKEVSEMESVIQLDRNHDSDTLSNQPSAKPEPQPEDTLAADYLPQYFLNHLVFSEVLSSISAGLALPWSERPDPLSRNKFHLKLLCPIDGGIYFLDKVVEEAASRLGADVTILDPQDLSEMVADYIGEGPDEATEALSALGFETPHVFNHSPESMQANEDAENEEDASEELSHEQGFPPKMGTLTTIPLSAAPKELQNIFRNMFGPGKSEPVAVDSASSWLAGKEPAGDDTSHTTTFASSGPKVAYNRRNEVKLTNLLEKLISANLRKREWLKLERKKIMTLLQSRVAQHGVPSESEQTVLSPQNSQPNRTPSFDDTAVPLAGIKTTHVTPGEENTTGSSKAVPKSIIVLRNFKEITHTPHGAKLVEKLVSLIGQRRQSGARIMLVGTSSLPGLAEHISAASLAQVQKSEAVEQFRALVVVPETNRGLYYQDERRRFREINGRHIYRMLIRIEPRFQDSEKKRGSRQFATRLQQYLKDSTHATYLEEQVLTFDEVHRVVFTALGQRNMEARQQDDEIHFDLGYIAAALDLIKKSDQVKADWGQVEYQLQNPDSDQKEKPSLESRLKKIRKTGTQHEKNLLRGVVDPENIHTTFKDVHAPAETIEALKTLTTLSLTRPEAFKYGVLAKDKITGLLLYGPPGTGKTLLAKAVARESGAVVLEVSGSDVYDMYVGEGEKNVRAIFSLAKKLAPCVVFIDEADAIFASRGTGTNRNSHRELINQFLREWDGMTETSAFIMVATNRPFDLDDAALRRLPRRLLVDLPSEKDRESILGIHLKDEIVEKEVSLTRLASQTPLYSGSDLKNVAVAAALAAVREENDEAAKHTGAEPYQYPEKRTLAMRHFDKAMEEISASVNEDMSSLGAIRKFDEKYGDRRGRRKKTSYGFSDGTAKEETAKVRT